MPTLNIKKLTQGRLTNLPCFFPDKLINLGIHLYPHLSAHMTLFQSLREEQKQ